MRGDVEHVREALADRYRILQELGHGGMATVYLAEDLRHQRKVALKVLRPELAMMLGEERFLNEIRVTANLNHPNIVQLHDSGVVDGIMYYVMPYLEGESLRQRLDRDGPLPIDEALSITRAVASALEYAHRHDVVHRDIKPDNIMLHEGVPLVTDFGIALATDPASRERLTMTGLSVGTPSYMSPEQAVGERLVRPSSDVYALACVLYEMLAGAPPFTAPNATALIARIIGERPTKLRAVRNTVPVAVEAAVDKALSKLPADRYQRATEFADALSASARDASSVPRAASVVRAVVIGLSLIAAAVLAWVTFGRSTPSRVADTSPPASGTSVAARASYVKPSEDPRPAIAVLAFVDMSPQHDQDYFSDGISEEILTALSKIRDLRVAARSTAFGFKGRDLDLKKVGEQLGVRYLLSGSVRKEGDQVRISAELVNAADGFRVWTESYDRRLKNVFAIQAEIAASISEALRVPLGLTRQELVLPTLDMAAHDMYLNGRAALRRRGRGVDEAIRLFEMAIGRDTNWAPAWAGLAEARAIRPLYDGKAGESWDSTLWATNLAKAEVAAKRALVLDPRSASAHVALGGVHRDRWEWEAGEREYREALKLDPDSHEAHTQYCELLWGMGRLDEALQEAERALALDRAPVRLDTYGFVLYMNRRNAEAEAALNEGIAIDTSGDLHFLRTVLATQLLLEGRYKEALSRFAFYIGDTTRYRMMGDALATRDPRRMPNGTSRALAQTWMLLGDRERALDALQAEVFRLPFRVKFNIWDPNLAALRDTPRFRDVILPRVKLRGAVARLAPSPAPRS